MKETLSNLKRVYSHGRKYKKNLIFFAILSILSIAINIIYPIFSAKQIVSLSSSLYQELLIASLICFGISILGDITRAILRKNTQIFFRGTTKDIQLAVSKELLKIELTSIDNKGSGTFIHRINNDTDEMSKIFTRGIGMLTGIFTDLGIYVAIFIINRVIFCFFLICSIILTTLHLIKVKKMNEKDKTYRKQREKTSSLIGELVRGIRDIKMLYAKDSFLSEIDKNIDDLTTSQFSFRNTEIHYNCLIDLTYDTCEILLIVLFVYFLSQGSLSIASAIILFNYRYRVFDNLMHNIGDLLQEIKSFNLSCNRVFSILDDQQFKKETFGTEKISKIKGNIELKDVYLGYSNKPVLKGMSFKVNANETVAFVGRSGVGKTTIFSLLCKLYSINSGKILLDGKDISLLDEESIRNNITIISQNPYIFNMSIRDNFRLVKENVTQKEILEACRLACLDKFIDELPDGYDTVVGEGGVTLSGGQRQRLAIARAFVQNTKIILFDEATSALDNETQNFIQQAINNMKDKYTILIIAHRLSTIVNADKIMLIEDGKVTATGTHQALLKENPTYQKLYQSELIKRD